MKVLVVDDQPEVLKQIASAVAAEKGIDGKAYDVTAESDHQAALGLLEKERFDVVVTDMLMGPDDVEGLEILRQLTEKSPVTLVLTAHPSIPNCVQAMRAGAWDYLEKVPEVRSNAYENLLKSIRQALRFRREHPEARRARGDTRWVHEHMGELMREYPGEVVAVLDQEVVGHNKSFAALTEEMDSRFPLAKPAMISIPDTRVDAVE